jgi:diguanylate cyclase (GGDEF)-like protein
MQSTRHHSVLAGLGIVILALASFAIWSAVRTNEATKHSSRATRMAIVFQRARFAVGEEESLERKYRLEPGPEVRQKYAQAAAELVASLHQIERTDPDERALARKLLRTHRAYLRGIDRMFAAVDQGETKLVLAIDAAETEPRFDVIEERVDAAATEHRSRALEELADLRQTERTILVATPIAFALGVLLLAACSVVLARVNRQLRRTAAENEHNALHDPLTGLPNRTLFADRLDHAMKRASREPAPFSLMMIDLDRFKEINDTLGHGTGDLLLQAVGPRIQQVLRPGDTVARLGGDEFAVLLPEIGSEEAREVAERVLAALRRRFALPELSVSVDASIGIVTYPTHGVDAETLLQHADVAMYLAKEQGRGETLYDAAQDPYDAGRLALAGELRRAIADDEFELHYQPKFDTASLEQAGVEALVRWCHPKRGLVPPMDFIPLAEHTGLVKPLTRLVLRKAARQARAWEEDGLDIRVAVNLSVANLLDLELVDDVTSILEQEGLEPSRLVLEITESMVMADPDRARDILDRLAGMGIGIAIDDFGTGHSSLAYLRRLPVVELKIDKSFVRHLAVDADDAAIVRSTIDLGHSLGLRVVAEGVEDGRSLELLRQFGCDEVQGFHLRRPAPADVVFDPAR